MFLRYCSNIVSMLSRACASATSAESMVFGTRHVPKRATTSRSNASAETTTAESLPAATFARTSTTDAMISPVWRARKVSAMSPIHPIVVSVVAYETVDA
jgi:hypothetical protein